MEKFIVTTKNPMSGEIISTYETTKRDVANAIFIKQVKEGTNSVSIFDQWTGTTLAFYKPY